MICSQCNNEFIKTSRGQKYCSSECAYEVRKITIKKYQQSDKGKKTTKSRLNNETKESRDKRLSKRRKYYNDNSEELIKKAMEYHKSPKGLINYKKNQSIYRKKNRKKLMAKSTIYQRKRYSEDAEYRSKTLAYAKTYRKKDSQVQWRRDYFNQRYNTDINFKVGINLFNRVKKAIKGYNKGSKSTISLLGCSVIEFREYIAEKFKPGMMWSNHGTKGWHIDHIKPIASFDLSKEAEQAKCFHYTNLQPLWAEDNLKKGDKY